MQTLWQIHTSALTSIGNEICGALEGREADIQIIRVDAFDRTADQVPLESDRAAWSRRHGQRQ